MRITNAVYAHYEGNGLEAGWQNSWHRAYYRIEGDEGAVLVDSDSKVQWIRHIPGEGVQTEGIPLVSAEWQGHNAIIHQFLNWLDDGPEPPTVIQDNIKSVAMLFGAIEASPSEQIVDVAAKAASVNG